MSVTHWAGGLTYAKRSGQSTICEPGYPACCSGERARMIARRGTQTWTRSDVTCQRCLALFDKESQL